jgi:hypothetical protein
VRAEKGENMKKIRIFAGAALTALIAGAPAMGLAQSQEIAEAAVDASAPVTVSGTTTTVHWGGDESWIFLNGTAEGESQARDWIIRLPTSRELLDVGLSAEVIHRDAQVTVSGYRLEDKACNPQCTMQGVTVTTGSPPQDYALGLGENATP